jgi:hypothetical protein
MTIKTNAKTSFEAPADFDKMTDSQATRLMAIWVAANPLARIYLIEGLWADGLPVYIRKPTGKRADIHRLVGDAGVEGIGIGPYLEKARKLGGGYRDVLAMHLGGFTPSSVGYGKPTIRLAA